MYVECRRYLTVHVTLCDLDMSFSIDVSEKQTPV